MARIKSPDEITRKYGRKSIMAYLESGKYCGINWITGVIRSSGLSKQILKELLESLKQYGNKKLYEHLYEICRDVDFDGSKI